jgi:hypothetical protein
MDLYIHEKPVWSHGIQFHNTPKATMSDIKAYLSERGLIAVPEEPSEEMLAAGEEEIETSHYGEGAGPCYKAMIGVFKEQAL